MMTPLLLWVALQQTPPSFEERRLASIPDGLVIDSPVFSANGGGVAYILSKGAKYSVFLNEEKGEEFTEIKGPVVISRNGQIVAYRASLGSKKYLVVGKKKRELAGEIGVLALSPDGSTVAYSVYDDKERAYRLIVGEKKGKLYNTIEDPVFSPDGKTVAYAAEGVHDSKKGWGWVVVVGEKEGKQYGRVWTPAFTRDGRKVVYRASANQKKFWVAGEKKVGEEYDNLGEAAMTSDGSKLAFGAVRDGRRLLVVGETSFHVEEGKGIGSVALSPDGAQWAFLRVTADASRIVWGDRILESSNCGAPVFSPDGTHLAFPAGRVGGVGICIADKDRETIGELWDFVGTPVFSSDGKKLAFGARKGTELWWKVSDVR